MRSRSIAVLARLGFLFGILAASAAGAQQVSPNAGQGAVHAGVNHVPVCPGPAAPATARCHSHVVADPAGKPLATATPKGYGPADLTGAYKIPTSTSNPLVAIVDAFGYPNAERDLGTYRAQFNLPPCTTSNGCFRKVDQNGGTNYPRSDTGWSQETALDLEMVSAICPNCSILLVEAKTNSLANLATAVNRAAVMGAVAISNSYGGGESGTSSYESAYTHSGIAITVSSGDSGYGVQFPASSPHVTAVGGTTLTKNSSTRGWTESAWSGAGSGCSKVYAKPTWQSDASCGMRTVADVSAVADPNTGVAVYAPVNSRSSGWMVFGGTSVSAPIVAAVYALNGGTVTYGSNPYDYLTAHPNYASGLFDVTSGSNGSCGGSYLCTAGTGYDGPTGLGTPNGVTAF